MKFETVELSSICKTNADSYSQNNDWQFVNYLDTGNITQNKISEIQYINLQSEKLPSRAKRKVKHNSILFSTVRPNQLHYGIIKSQPKNFLVSTGFAVIDIDETKANADFIYYYLIQNDIIQHLQAIAEQSTSAYPSIKASDIENLIIKIPDLKTQHKIGGLLKSLDDKIALNTTINENLEQQAQAIFDKIFPDVITGKHTVGEYITPKRGKGLLSKDAILGDIPVIAGGLEPATYHNKANTTAPVLTISASGANAGYVNLWNIPIWSSDSSFIDSTMTENVYFWYVMLKKRQKEIFDSQTGSAQPHVYPQHIAGMSIGELKNDDIFTYVKIVQPLFEMIGRNIAENKTLSATRDTLLPKLMSGEIEV